MLSQVEHPDDRGPFGINPGSESASSYFFRSRYSPARKGKSHIRLALLLMIGTFFFPAGAETETGDSLSKAIQKAHKVTISAYTNVPECTDSTPNETASLLRIKQKHYWKIIALSRDLAKNYDFGDRFLLSINGEYHMVEFQDLMAAKYKNSIDLLLPSVKKCQKFGKKAGVLIPLDKSAELPASPRG